MVALSRARSGLFRAEVFELGSDLADELTEDWSVATERLELSGESDFCLSWEVELSVEVGRDGDSWEPDKSSPELLRLELLEPW